MEQLKSVEQFQEIVKKETAVFLFSADWCPDCRVIEPYLPRMEADFPTFNYYYVDRDQFVDLCDIHTSASIIHIDDYAAAKELLVKLVKESDSSTLASILQQ